MGNKIKLKSLLEIIKNHRLFIVFTIFYLVFSFATYKDYGITFDEKVEYDAGKYLAKYYTTPTTADYIDEMINDGPVNIETRHLPLFSVYSRIYVMFLTLINFKFYFEWFHLLNMLFGYLLFLFSYLLFVSGGFKTKKAVLAPVLVFFTPYVTGHIPANPKDIPFAWAYLAGLYFIYLFSKRKADIRARILLLGIVFGFAISLRAAGISLFFISLIFDFVYSSKKIPEYLTEYLLISIVSLFIWILFMPWLGANFFINAVGSVINAKGYSDWKGVIFYLGEFLSKYQRPWHYLFVLLTVKLPIPIFIFLVWGIVSYTIYLTKLVSKIIYTIIFSKIKIITKFVPIKKTPLETLLFTAIASNIIIYLSAKPVIYNGIRHYLFLVVLCVLFSVNYLIKFFGDTNSDRSFDKAENSKVKYGDSRYTIKNSIAALCVVYFVFTGVRMIHLHPFEYVYFNESTYGLKGAQNLFQLDYWGASYKEASEYALQLAENNNISDLKIFTCDSRFAVDYYSKFKYRLVGAPKEADILFCDNFRDKIRKFEQPVIHTIKRENTVLLYVRAQPLFYSRYQDFSYK